MSTCVFCGRAGTQTREHVLPDWLTGIGLEVSPVRYRAGWLNRLARDLGEGHPFKQTVRDVCADCNNGWMSRLEARAQRVLRPLILGEPAVIEAADAGMVAAWTHKTALVAMLVSSAKDRASGYGLPPSEYRAVYDAREAMLPLEASQFWIGQYIGPGIAHEQVTPLVVRAEGRAEPERPHAYVMTIIVGRLVLHGVRFTAPEMEVRLSTRRALPQLWPGLQRIPLPSGTPVDEAGILAFCDGKELQVEDLPLTISPWGPATDLSESRLVGSTIELDALCGKHVIYYPAVLARQAMRGIPHAFVTSCECPVAYLIETRADGAHCTAAGDGEAIEARYDELHGDELVVRNESGEFIAKRLLSGSPGAGGSEADDRRPSR